MAENESNMNIYQKLAKIRKQVDILQKDKSGYGYTYVSEEEILSKIKGWMDRYSLSLVPCIVPGTQEVTPYTYKKTKVKKNGDVYEEVNNDIIVSSEMQWGWINNDNPDERVVIDWFMVGQQSDASQAFGSGLTYANRYFLLKFFNVATSDDDPDAFRSKQKEAEAAADRMVAQEIIKDFDAAIKKYLTSHAGEVEKVKKFVSKYARGGDYFKISDPKLASQLVEDFEKDFNTKE